MKRVWLVSYPKSGNTWFRVLIAALSVTDERPLDINALAEPSGMVSTRETIDHATMIDSSLLTHDEGDALRSHFQTEAAKGQRADRSGPQVRFYKVHDAYTYASHGEPVLGSNKAAAAIALVRDPRDVAVSLAAHFGCGIDRAIDFMGRPDAALGGATDDRIPHFRQRLLTWAGHAASWFDQRDVAVHVVRYESLLADTADIFHEAMVFAGRNVTRAEALRAVRLAAFERLQAQERERGFREGPLHAPFFRKGRAGAWRDVLSKAQIVRIEREQAPMMARLGYAGGARGHGMAIRGVP